MTTFNNRETAQAIADILKERGFDDITDSSGYFALIRFDDDTDRCVDVYKSTGEGTEQPHYVIYVSYEDEDFDFAYTESLSVDELTEKLDELTKVEI